MAQIKVRHLTAAGLIAVTSMLGKLEHRELRAYMDIGGYVTYCDGIRTPGVKEGDTFTNAQCDKLTFAEIQDHINVIDKYVTGDISQETLEALILLVHNIGETQFAHSTAVKRFNAGDIKGGCEALTWFNQVHGKVVQGLVNRRKFEHDLCLKGIQ
jgi:lysozyme